MTPERKKPGRFSEGRPESDDQMAGSEGGDPDEPRFREPSPADPREEVKKRASRYAMEDPEEAVRRKRRDSEKREGREGIGRESRPHFEAPIPEEKELPDERDFPEKADEPGTDQEDDAWSRLDRDN